jgi:tetratricopeptide (TPR) repeat protein
MGNNLTIFKEVAGLSKKKNTQMTVSQEENTQVQHVFEHYQQIAANLHASKDQEQAETALAEITNLSESAQIALLKELAKENQVAAADVLTAIHELSTLKSVRKEARRSLIRLEGAKIYPHWESPVERTPAISALQPTSTNPPRFWKGLVSDTRETGEVQLLLFWEQGDDYRDIRIFGFLLEFWHDGVKDFFTSIDRKRGVETFIAEVRRSMPDVEMEDCSLAQGRRLLLEALATNKKHGTTPHKDYRFNLSLIKQLVLEAPDLGEDADLDEDNISEKSKNLHGLPPQDVIIEFVESWVDEDYGTAYDLLSQDSPLREGLSRDEWIERRESWAAEANPDRLQPSFIFEHEAPKPMVWLPNPVIVHYTKKHKKFETAWSIELENTPLSGILPELPKATAIYEETGRHWFWASYNLVQEDDDWRIETMTDEGVNAQDLSVQELQAKIQELDSQANEVAVKHEIRGIEQLSEEETMAYFAELTEPLVRSFYYSDILIKKSPSDRSAYEEALARMSTLGFYERCLTYLILLAQQFPEERGLYLRQIAALQLQLSKKMWEDDDDERAERFEELAKQTLRESLAVENNYKTHISLVHILLEDERFDEAEEHLLRAKELIANTDPEEEAHVELHLGGIAMEREQFEEALSHYQRVVEFKPNSAGSWFNVGEAHRALEHFEEAETSYKRAIELDPDSPGYYYALSALYKKQDQPSKALQTLEEGLAANPDDIASHLYLVSLYIEREDYHQADKLLSKAERIDPDSLDVRSFRYVLKAEKSKHTHDTKKPNQPLKQKKKKRR